MFANLTDATFSLNCNYTGSEQLIWIKTVEKENLFYVNGTDRVVLSSDGTILYLKNLTLADEEFYGCGYMSNTGKFYLVNAFYVYIKITPQIEFITEHSDVGSKYLNASSFRITCIALNSKRDTYLTINDADTMFPLSTKVTNSETKYCNKLDLCTIMHQVEVLTDTLPYLATSKNYTCSALSTIPSIEALGTKTVRIDLNSTLAESNKI